MKEVASTLFVSHREDETPIAAILLSDTDVKIKFDRMLTPAEVKRLGPSFRRMADKLEAWDTPDAVQS